MNRINPVIFLSICVSVLMGIIIGCISRTLMYNSTQPPKDEEAISVRQS